MVVAKRNNCKNNNQSSATSDEEKERPTNDTACSKTLAKLEGSKVAATTLANNSNRNNNNNNNNNLPPLDDGEKESNHGQSKTVQEENDGDGEEKGEDGWEILSSDQSHSNGNSSSSSNSNNHQSVLMGLAIKKILKTRNGMVSKIGSSNSSAANIVIDESNKEGMHPPRSKKKNKIKTTAHEAVPFTKAAKAEDFYKVSKPEADVWLFAFFMSDKRTTLIVSPLYLFLQASPQHDMFGVELQSLA